VGGMADVAVASPQRRMRRVGRAAIDRVEAHRKGRGTRWASRHGATFDPPRAPRPPPPTRPGASPARGRLGPGHPARTACVRAFHARGAQWASLRGGSSFGLQPSCFPELCRNDPKLGASRVAFGQSSFGIAPAARTGLRPRDSPGLRGPPSGGPRDAFFALFEGTCGRGAPSLQRPSGGW
jgi:hypothetical protein